MLAFDLSDFQYKMICDAAASAAAESGPSTICFLQQCFLRAELE